MLLDIFRRFDLDPPELAGGVAVWLCSPQARFLSGKLMNANWSVDELVKRKDEIVQGGLLEPGLTGRLGKDQFR